MARRWKFALAGLAVLAACSDTTVKDRYAGVVVYDDFPASAKGSDHSDDFGLPAAFVLSAGFVDGKAYQYLDLGEFNPVVPKMYLLMRDGAPVEGQYPIIDTLPDKDDYSPWWQVVEVEVPSDYVANDIKSKKSVDASGYTQNATMEAVHCPVINPDAAWISADFAATLTIFWGTGELVPNPNYGFGDDDRPVLADEDATASDIMLTPVWHKRLRAFCYAEDFTGRAALVVGDDDTTVQLDFDGLNGRYDVDVFGLFPVFDAAPGDAGYAAAVFGYAALPTTIGQPGSTSDLDGDTVEALDVLVDNPIIMPLDLHRFEVTISNTTATDGSGTGISDGLANVSDGDGVLFELDAAASDAIGSLAVDGDASYLQSDYGLIEPFLDVVQSSQELPALAPGESISFVLLGTPYYAYLSAAQAVDHDDAFTGVPLMSLYDDNFAPVATQSEDLMVFASNYEVEDGVVAAHADLTDAIGTITVKLLGGAQ